MTTQRVILTYKEYEALPADGRRYEIHEGELSVTPAPSPQHQIISSNLFRVLDAHIGATGGGRVLYSPLDVILSHTTIVQPDIVYLDRGRLGAISQRGIEGAPTLVVEIISPSTTLTDRAPSISSMPATACPSSGWWIPRDARSRPSSWVPKDIRFRSAPPVPTP